MLLIYTGNGKGKTSAAIGQVIRAYGHGLRVVFGQFMKSDMQTGEQKVLSNILGENFLTLGAGFFRDENERLVHRKSAEQLWKWIYSRLDNCDMLILDESLYALNCGLITQEEIMDIISRTKSLSCHLVLTGRGLPDWLLEEADLVTEMLEVKHPYNRGIKAKKGVEF